ncbi:cupin domain-containing protein [Halovulum dunhuangense]|nr:cupin domain-containing protein [Halovulum dunhuangense]
MTATRHRTWHLLGNILKFHAFSAETGGRYALVEALSAPGAGAPPNRHAGEDEAFYILEGEYAFMVDGDMRRARAGDYVRVPDGALHAFTCVSETPGRMLIINAPGTVHDRFFTEAGEPLPEGATDFPAPKGAPDIPALVAIADRAGVRIEVPAPA